MNRVPTRHVALIYDARLPYDIRVMTGVAAYVREVNNWDIYIEERALREQRLPDLRRWKGDGVIANFDDRSVAAQVQSSGLKAVAFGGGRGWYDPALGIPYVEPDEAAIARLAADHLRQRGFCHFAYCGYAPNKINAWVRKRWRAFSTALQQKGFSCTSYDSRQDRSAGWPELRENLSAWVQSLPKPVGMMCANDARAREVVDACRLVGIRVPEDVAVVGVDNDEMICHLSSPPLSSIDHGAREVGYRAAALLDKVMRGEQPDRQNILVEPVEVVCRQSTDVLAVDDRTVAEALRLIRQQACAGLTPRMVERAVGCSRTQLEPKFKKLLRRTVYAEIRRVQFGTAERLVRTTSLPIKEVAQRAGFSSVQHMTTIFHRLLGVTPAKLRRRSRLGGSPAGTDQRLRFATQFSA